MTKYTSAKGAKELKDAEVHEIVSEEERSSPGSEAGESDEGAGSQKSAPGSRSEAGSDREEDMNSREENLKAKLKESFLKSQVLRENMIYYYQLLIDFTSVEKSGIMKLKNLL